MSMVVNAENSHSSSKLFDGSGTLNSFLNSMLVQVEIMC